jgi:uptake hydrogenase large subunit
MNAIEGQLNIDLYPHKIAQARVEISSSRPLQACRVMIGKTPEEALKVLPLMYNVCGVAQARTSLKAIQSNLAIPEKRNAEAAREMLVLVENAREHLFRILVDWPTLFKLEQDQSQLPQLGRLIKEFKVALFANGDAFALHSQLQPDSQLLHQLIDQLENTMQQAIYHQPTEQWLQINDIDTLYDWSKGHDSTATNSLSIICDHGWTSQGFSRLDALPELDDNELIQRFNDSTADQFIAQPDWHGQQYETTTLSRQMDQPLIQSLAQEFHNTLITRWVARLLELARIPNQLRQLLTDIESSDSSSPTVASSNMGLAQTEAARGRLIHRVEIDNGLISQYQILAPTEWNFHPQGLIAHSLGNLTSKDPELLQKLARLMINVIDPCVGYELKVH